MTPTAQLKGTWPNVFQAAMGDGSVRAISTNVDAKILQALFTKQGGEVIDWGALNGPRERDGHAVPDAAPPELEERTIPEEEAEFELERVP